MPSPRHPVLDLLFARAASRSRPGRRQDDYKLGLAIEGGGMRGVVSAGMACALERLDLLEAFDAVYGASAGAVNGAFFVARQAVYGTPLYWENINNRRFINYLRLGSGNPVLSLDFLLGHVMVNEKTLDWQAALAGPVPLKAVAVSLEPMEAVLLTAFGSRGELFDALRASATIPLVAGPPTEIGRRRYIDGGMLEPLAFKSALEDGCTHVLVFPTLPAGEIRFHNPLLTEPIVSRALERVAPGLSRPYRTRRKRYLADYERLAEATLRPHGPPHLFAIRPHESNSRVHWFERRRRNLEEGALAGMEAVFLALVGDPREDLWPEGWAG
jgi:predicted patatin/cPLA2 family phospholipase